MEIYTDGINYFHIRVATIQIMLGKLVAHRSIVMLHSSKQYIPLSIYANTSRILCAMIVNMHTHVSIEARLFKYSFMHAD